MSSSKLAVSAFLAAILLSGAALAQTPAPAKPVVETGPHRPELLWKEVWKPSPDGVEKPISLTGSLGNPNLELKMYGPGPSLQTLGFVGDDASPAHVFSGEAKGPMAFAFRLKGAYADLTGLSRIRVNTKMSGLHRVYPVVKLASGDWYMAERSAGASTKDYVVEEVPLSDTRWFKLDIANVVTKGNPVDKIDLSKVEEIGFADLIPASGHGPGGWFDVAQIEVYGKAVPR